jgi:hypothetical protein
MKAMNIKFERMTINATGLSGNFDLDFYGTRLTDNVLLGHYINSLTDKPIYKTINLCTTNGIHIRWFETSYTSLKIAQLKEIIVKNADLLRDSVILAEISKLEYSHQLQEFIKDKSVETYAKEVMEFVEKIQGILQAENN